MAGYESAGYSGGIRSRHRSAACLLRLVMCRSDGRTSTSRCVRGAPMIHRVPAVAGASLRCLQVRGHAPQPALPAVNPPRAIPVISPIGNLHRLILLIAFTQAGGPQLVVCFERAVWCSDPWAGLALPLRSQARSLRGHLHDDHLLDRAGVVDEERQNAVEVSTPAGSFVGVLDAQNATRPDWDLQRHQLGAEPSGRPGRTGGPWRDPHCGNGWRAIKATARRLSALLVATGSSTLPLV
jgi:hypothetical protein